MRIFTNLFCTFLIVQTLTDGAFANNSTIVMAAAPLIKPALYQSQLNSKLQSLEQIIGANRLGGSYKSPYHSNSTDDVSKYNKIAYRASTSSPYGGSQYAKKYWSGPGYLNVSNGGSVLSSGPSSSENKAENSVRGSTPPPPSSSRTASNPPASSNRNSPSVHSATPPAASTNQPAASTNPPSTSTNPPAVSTTPPAASATAPVASTYPSTNNGNSAYPSTTNGNRAYPSNSPYPSSNYNPPSAYPSSNTAYQSPGPYSEPPYNSYQNYPNPNSYNGYPPSSSAYNGMDPKLPSIVVNATAN